MKKINAVLSMVIFTVCMTGCGNSADNMSSSQTGSTNTSAVSVPVQETGSTAASPEATGISGKTKTLVAYFSATGTTKVIAETIAAEAGADIFEIVPAEPYSYDDLNYNTDCRANREQNDSSARPEIKESIDVSAYDTIFVGYPIWWGQAPKIMYTFMESTDFSGKTVIPFCTSGSSGIGSSAKNLSACASGANWLDGRRFSGSAKESDVISWVDSLDLKE